MTTIEQSHAGTDPVTTEIIRGALISIADEMKQNLMRTAYNPIIFEALDFTVGIFDRNGDTVSIGLGLPMFIRGLSAAVKAKITHYAQEPLTPGDIVVTNDAYITGSHLNHIVVTQPIFVDGEIVAYASTMAHWQDIGGVLGGVTTDIYSEGLQVPIVKLFKAGVQDEEIVSIIKQNVRFSHLAMGDLRAQVAAVRTGERRLMALLGRYGVDTYERAVESMFDQSDRLSRLAVAGIADGEYEAHAFMDDDGVGNEPVEIRVRVVVSGEEMTVDLTGISPQVNGYFNSGAATGVAAAQVAFRCLTTPDLYPLNDGTYRSLKVLLPEGTVVSAVRPAAMQLWMTVPMTVIDTIIAALAPAVPERVAAAHYADLCYRTVHGIDERNDTFYVGLIGVPGGGWGARNDSDGANATICINDGDTHNSPIESTERKWPIVVEQYALRSDSGGAGRYRGGLGVEQRVRMLSRGKLSCSIERTQCAPWGVAGGLPGLPNGVWIERAGEKVFQRNGKLDNVDLSAGDVSVVVTGGGGGYGVPHERPVEMVVDDVRNGYVSRDKAESVYGVVIDTAGEVDLDATRRLRRVGG